MSSTKLPPDVDIEGFTYSGDTVLGLVDVSHFPLTFDRKLGEPTEQYIHDFYAWRRACSLHAYKMGTVHINVMDFNAWNVPKPTIRKLISEYSRQDLEEPGFCWQYLVITKAVMRGAITAISWMRGDKSAYTFVATQEEAITRAKKMYEERGLSAPDIDPSSFVFVHDR